MPVLQSTGNAYSSGLRKVLKKVVWLEKGLCNCMRLGLLKKTGYDCNWFR